MSQYALRPKDLGEFTREEAFELYLEPKSPEPGEIACSAMTHREQSFHSLRAGGFTWIESERQYQEWCERQ
jgi:hypothetical protein